MRRSVKAAKRNIAREIRNTRPIDAESASPPTETVNQTPSAPPIPTVQISTTVGDETSISTVPLKRIHSVSDSQAGLADVTLCVLGPRSQNSNSLGDDSANEEDVDEDFVLAEETPSSVQVCV